MSCEDDFINSTQMTLQAVVEAIIQIQKVKFDSRLIENLQLHNLNDELNKIKQKIKNNILVDLSSKTVFKRFSDVRQMYDYLINNKPNDEFILSHGDVSMPNIFIDNNKFTGFIDVGNAGIRQKWYDIADCYVSVRRNFESQEMADKFLNMLGVVDKSKVEYYEMLIALS